MTINEAALSCWPGPLGALAVDLAATARQHGASDPDRVAAAVIRRNAGQLAGLLQQLHAASAAAALTARGSAAPCADPR